MPAADENILNSTRSTDFITPKTDAARAYRDAVLDLAATHAFARPLVNSGRLSRPAMLRGQPADTAGSAPWAGGAPPGAPAPDAPVLVDGRPDWLLRHLGADGVSPCWSSPPDPRRWRAAGRRRAGLRDGGGRRPARCGTTAGSPPRASARRAGAAVLLRPDQHVAARFRAGAATPAAIAAALRPRAREGGGAA